MTEGKVNSRYQLTLPVEVRKALGVKPGDRVRYEVKGGELQVSIVGPSIDEVLEQLWQEYDMTALQQEIGGDAVAYVREQRGWDDWD